MTPYNPYYAKSVMVERQRQAEKARLIRELQRNRQTPGPIGGLVAWLREPASSTSLFVPSTDPSA